MLLLCFVASHLVLVAVLLQKPPTPVWLGSASSH